MVEGDNREDVAEVGRGVGDPLRARTMARAYAVLRGWARGDGQQRGGASAACGRSGPQELFVRGIDAGGERAAAIYSLLGSAKLNGMDPKAYLTTVLRRIADHPINRIEELLPWNLVPATAEAD